MRQLFAICFIVLAVLGGAFVWDYYSGTHATEAVFKAILHFLNCTYNYGKALIGK